MVLALMGSTAVALRRPRRSRQCTVQSDRPDSGKSRYFAVSGDKKCSPDIATVVSHCDLNDRCNSRLSTMMLQPWQV